MEANEKDREVIQTQLEVLRFLSDSTDDYLFSWNFKEDKIYFPGPIWKRYAIMDVRKHDRYWAFPQDS